MLQGSYRGVTGMFQGRYRRITRVCRVVTGVFQGCYSGVTGLFAELRHGCVRGVAGLLQRCYSSDTSALQGHYRYVTGMSQGCNRGYTLI